MKRVSNILVSIATMCMVAIVVYSCKSNLGQADALNIADVPLQTIDDMSAIQTDKGKMQMRIYAPVMQSFDNDSSSYDLFPQGIVVYSYNEQGQLESTITAKNAKHFKMKKFGEETWSAFGNVVIENVIKQEKMQTDTLYWDRYKEEIYTDCYVKMYSPDGFMQGYGMRSDQRARNSIIMRPFNSFGVVVQDSTSVLLDTVNFIGPMPRK